MDKGEMPGCSPLPDEVSGGGFSLSRQPTKAPPVRACTAVGIPELNVTVRNERGLPLMGASIHTERDKDGLSVRVSAPNYQPAGKTGIKVPRTPDGCHPITQKVNFILQPTADAPPVLGFQLTGYGHPFGLYLDATPEIVRQGGTWSLNPPNLGHIDAKTGFYVPPCLEKRGWVKIKATLNADPTQRASASFEIPAGMRGCRP